MNRPPPMRTDPSPPPNTAGPYREDCWSPGATAALIDAWGDRYLELNRGNLRQKDWQDVADTVNSRPAAARRAPRTDSQCKNRIDTIKKKYKSERARIMDGVVVNSQWPFYSQLDSLIGSSPSVNKPMSVSLPLAVPMPMYRKPSTLVAAGRLAPPTSLPINGSGLFRGNYSAAAAAAAAAAADESMSSASEEEEDPVPVGMKRVRVEEEEEEYGHRQMPMKRARAEVEEEEEEEEDVDGVRKLAMAIDRFAEVYERVEREKLRQMMELERQRIEFARGMEYKRMQMFVDAQVKFERAKSSRRADASEKGFSAAMSLLCLPAAFDL